MFIRGQAHYVKLHLVDNVGDDIEESDGAPTVKLSRDGSVYDTPTNEPRHIDEDLWVLLVTADEARCNSYDIKATHPNMSGPYFVVDEAWYSTREGASISDVETAVMSSSGSGAFGG